MKKILFLLLLLGTIHAKNYTYEYSIAAMFKDEMDILPEWIEYHRLLGFEHFWLYNNSSSDHYLEFLVPYIQKGIVELIDWPCPQGVNWTDFQGRAYRDALFRSKNKSKWLAIIDIDEFIVPVHGKEDFKKRLVEFEKIPDCGGVALYWLMFGTSHLYDIPPGALLTERLLYRSHQTYHSNYSIKTICRPERVHVSYIHWCSYKPPYRDYTIDKGRFDPSMPQQGALAIEPIRIHHYWTRTEKHLREVKSPRRALCDGVPFSEEQVADFDIELNEVYDDTILQYIPELRKRLGR